MPFAVGHTDTILVVEAADSVGEVNSVSANLTTLVESILPSNMGDLWTAGEAAYNTWLASWAVDNMSYEAADGIWWKAFDLDNVLFDLDANLSAQDFDTVLWEGLEPGKIDIPVTVTDKAGNETTGEIELAIVDVMMPLKEGWNLVSTPITLDSSATTWAQVKALCDNTAWIDAIVRYNSAASTPGWGNVDSTYSIQPLESFYIHTTENNQLGFVFKRGYSAPPTRTVYDVWNLIGLGKKTSPVAVDTAMETVEVATGPTGDVTGYVMVVSVPQTINYTEEYTYDTVDLSGITYGLSDYNWTLTQADWMYIAGVGVADNMEAGGGYWLFMENDDILAGLSSTPLDLNYP